jgi:hypothetical protein
LVYLFLHDNKLTGIIPKEIENLTDLRVGYFTLYNNCNLYTDDPDTQAFIDAKSEEEKGYQYILDTNSHDCVVLTPIITYLLF